VQRTWRAVPALAGLAILAIASSCMTNDWAPGVRLAGKADTSESDWGDPQPDPVDELGELQWSMTAALVGGPQGRPLFVSNNPEHVSGFGVLAGIPYPGLSLSGARRADGAPEAQWSRGVVDERCPNGGLREFGVYLAHILPATLGAGRSLSLVVVPEEDVEVRVRGATGTTGWSDAEGLLTRRSDWLGARIARAFFFETAPERTLTGRGGDVLVIDTQRVVSLVEGRYEISASGCVYPFTVAHSGELGELPGNYAPGDVKWPGWSNGRGYGRAAGVYEGDGWAGEQEVVIARAASAQGVGMLRSQESVRALARHGDSAEILFGNYGLRYEQTFVITNASGQCVDVEADFVSYLDRNNTPDRAPNYQFFLDTEGAYTPSMFWNGPVRTTVGGAASTVDQPILYLNVTEAARSAPERALDSMFWTLAAFRIEAGASQRIAVEVPVPGYIVAPVAIAFVSTPCSGAAPAEPLPESAGADPRAGEEKSHAPDDDPASGAPEDATACEVACADYGASAGECSADTEGSFWRCSDDGCLENVGSCD
jgi:hypothetical protein